MFDVVIPLYNKEKTIFDCLNSVFLQKEFVNNVIIVDDGSTDTSARIAREYIRKRNLPWIFLEQENSGVSTSRNKGFDASTAQFVCFLDADDFWLDGFAESMADLIIRTQGCVFWSCGHIERRGKNAIKSFDFSSVPEVVESYFTFAKRLPIVNSSKVIVRRDCFEAVGKFPEGKHLGEDLFLWGEFARLGSLGFLSGAFVTIDKGVTESRGKRVAEHSPYFLDVAELRTVSQSEFLVDELEWLNGTLLKHSLVAKVGGNSSLAIRSARLFYSNRLFFKSISFIILYWSPRVFLRLVILLSKVF